MAVHSRDIEMIEEPEQAQDVPPLPQRDRLKAAMISVMKDQEGKYDECLVEDFFDIKTEDEDDIFAIAFQVVQEIYADPESASFNHHRVALFHLAYLTSYIMPCPSGAPTKEFILKSSKLLWSRLPQVIRQDDQKAIQVVLLFLRDYVDYGFKWILARQFTRPIQPSGIKDIVSLAKYFLTRKTYSRTQAYACDLMASLVKRAGRTETPRPFYKKLKQNIEELLEVGWRGWLNQVLYRSIAQINNGTKSDIIERLGLEDLLRRYLEKALAQKDKAKVLLASECLALAAIEDNSIVEQLRDAGQLEAIIVYATELHEDIFSNTSLMHYLIYIILLHCQGENTKELVTRSSITKAEKQFIRRHMRDSYVALCLKYLKMSLSMKMPEPGGAGPPKRTLTLLLDVLVHFIRSNYNDNLEHEYENLLECCTTLRNVQKLLTRASDVEWLYGLMDELLKLIEPFRDIVASCNRKTFVIAIIELMGESIRTIKDAPWKDCPAKAQSYRMSVIQFANKLTQPEMFKAIVALFAKAEFDFAKDLVTDRPYVNLVFKRIYKLAREERDFNLLANVTVLLVPIDLYANEELLKQFGILHDTVPALLIELMFWFGTSAPEADRTAIKHILKTINHGYQARTDGRWTGYKASYLNRMCHTSSGESIERLARAICLVIEVYILEGFVRPLLESLDTIVHVYIRLEPNPMEILIRTRILENIYRAHEYVEFKDKDLFGYFCRFVGSLHNENVIRGNSLDTIIGLIRENSPNDLARQQRASELVRFYGSSCTGGCYLDYTSHTHVNRIQNQGAGSVLHY